MPSPQMCGNDSGATTVEKFKKKDFHAGHPKPIWFCKGPLILLCQIISVEYPTIFECTMVSCHLKLIWFLNFKIVLKIDPQMAFLYGDQTKSNTNQSQFRAYTTMGKVPPNLKLVGHSTENIWQGKKRGPL